MPFSSRRCFESTTAQSPVLQLEWQQGCRVEELHADQTFTTRHTTHTVQRRLQVSKNTCPEPHPIALCHANPLQMTCPALVNRLLHNCGVVCGLCAQLQRHMCIIISCVSNQPITYKHTDQDSAHWDKLLTTHPMCCCHAPTTKGYELHCLHCLHNTLWSALWLHQHSHSVHCLPHSLAHSCWHRRSFESGRVCWNDVRVKGTDPPTRCSNTPTILETALRQLQHTEDKNVTSQKVHW